MNQSISFSFISGLFILPIFLLRMDCSVVAVATAEFIYLLLFFHYLAWVFGMGEAAIRIRLLRELLARPSHMATLNEIMANYNAEKVLEYRLARLVGSGHLTFDGKFYSIKNTILILQVIVCSKVKRILGIPLSN